MDVHIVSQAPQTDVVIIGVSRHQQTIHNWSTIVKNSGLPLDKWIKSGDIDLTVGALTVLPTDSGRIVCVGLDHRKQLNAKKMMHVFEQLGQFMMQKKWPRATILLETFITPHVTLQQCAIYAIEQIQYGSYIVPRYQTFSNEADVCIEHLYFVTAEALSIDDAVRRATWLAHFRTLADEPPNILTPMRIAQAVTQFFSTEQLDVQVLSANTLTALGFGALCAAYEQDVQLLLVNATLEAQHTIVAASTNRSCMPLFSACIAVATYPMMGVFVIGTPKALPDHAVITTMSGKTVELRAGADVNDIALLDVLCFAGTQRAKTITSVTSLHSDHVALYGEAAMVLFTNRPADQAATVVLTTTAPPPSRQADVCVKYDDVARTVRRANLYHLFVHVPWCHLELPANPQLQWQHLEVRCRNLFKEETT